MNLDTWAHVQTGRCHATWCDWSGFHWHWDVQRFRTIAELNRFDVEAMNEELLRQP